MGGVVMMLAGAAVYYCTQLQPTIALSSTEAEFVNMADTGKVALYIRWILEELGIIQIYPTTICAGNHGACHMAKAQKPTRRTRHIELKHFVILQSTDNKYIAFLETPTKNMHSDSLSKLTDRKKFYKHMDMFMGRRKPQYTKDENIRIIHYICINRTTQNPIAHNPLYDLVANPQD